MISYLYSFDPCVGIIENCKYFIAALIYKNIESEHHRGTPVRVKRLDNETIYLNFRLYIGIANFNDMDEFVFITKQKGQRK